jgi:hypothetical protein
VFKRRSKFNKYNATRADGFPSLLERSVYMMLLERERSGEISDIKRQQAVVLQDGPKDVRIVWKIDFSFVRNGRVEYAEAKGLATNDFVLKLKLFKKNPPSRLEIWRGVHTRPFLAEVIEP